MIDMTVSIAGVELKNPVIAASGTFAFGEEYGLHMDVAALGGMALKALTREKRQGNPPPRIAETASGVLNAVGLQNPGVDEFLEKKYPRVRTIGTVQIANIAGAVEEDYLYVTERLNDTDIELFELNVSCPNVKQGGIGFGTDAAVLENLTAKVKSIAKKPLIVKLTPNVTSIADMALAARDGGADALSLINTITGMAIDPYFRRPVLGNVTGGLSGPAVKPVALRMVYEAYRAKPGIPIIGMGGVMTGLDAVEFMIAGADAVMAGTATMANPTGLLGIIRGIEEYCVLQDVGRVRELTGTLVTE